MTMLRSSRQMEEAIAARTPDTKPVACSIFHRQRREVPRLRICEEVAHGSL